MTPTQAAAAATHPDGLATRRRESDRLSPADWVTLTRASLVVAVAVLVAESFAGAPHRTLLVSVAAVALVLDAVDGWVARRTRTTVRGARLDGEVDAVLILILSVYVARSAGAWVLAIGAARYAFLLAGWLRPWMRAPLPPRFWRKVVCATQGVVLTIAAANVLPPDVSVAVLLIALALLGESFGRDVWWLWSNRHGTLSRVAVGVDAGIAASPRFGRTSAQRVGAAALTILAFLIVWVALVAPDQPKYLEPAAFLRLPLEGVVLVALALALPATARRFLPVLAGPALALIVIVKVLNVGFFTTFERPFDPLGDSGNVGIGIETLRAAIGRTRTNLVVIGVVIGVLALLVLTTFAARRVMRTAADNRRLAIRSLAAIGGVWMLCWVAGAHIIAQTPIASTLSAGLVVDEVRAVQADLHDSGVFATQIRNDPFRNLPGDQLLNALRGKDVLLVFVESYGRVTVQGSSFSPAVDSLLDKGTTALTAAGFSARSAFLTSSTFGGVSWLAHSTLQGGVWVNSQRRYDQLMRTDRFTLSDAFRRAGWRTVDDKPADDRDWPQGSSFYHYDKVYDRRDVGYRGPTFTYAPMPDQYMFAALQRLELAPAHRRPLFAEVETVSSHMPWNRIPRQVGWRDVGDGSIFKRTPMEHETGAFWSNPARVKAAYGRSIEYSLNTLISFVRHFGKRNLVLVVVGDEAPLPIVSGQGASHDVPISIIAHDPAVLRRLGGWRWERGLRPSPSAPVWPMSAFRNRFLSAFDASPSSGSSS